MKPINGLSIPSDLADLCTPRMMALLVYDMQVGIVGQVKGGTEIARQVARAIAIARGAGMRIVYTRHLSLPKTWMGVSAFRMAMAWQRKQEPQEVDPWFLRDTPGFEIAAELAPRPEDAVFDKLAMSAFEGTPLATALRDCGIVALAIVGIATEIGIEPTVRHAADLGFVPVLLTDACGAGHREAGERALDSMRFMGDALFSDVDDFEALLAAA